jgi:hypothetical protein
MTTRRNPQPKVGPGETASNPAPRRRKAPAKQLAAVLEAQPEQTLVSYDENLLERARTQWQFGDWQSLAQLSRDTLQYHPDRAKLALLAAAGQLQTGQDAEAKQFIRLAQGWGVSKRLVSQILIAGVHNSLGRVAAIGNQQHRALQHFEDAIAIGTPGSDAKLLTQARSGYQLSQLGLPPPAGYIKVGAGETEMPVPKLPLLSKNIEVLSDTLKQQKAELDAQLKKQNDALTDLRKHIDGRLKQEMLNATQQLEAFLDIQSFFNNGQHLPAMHGWPVSPDFARYLIQLLEKNHYDLVLEFGSGTSTVLIAKALAKLEREHQGKPAVVQVAFEHLEKYHAQTLADLESNGLAQSVQLTLAPLQPYQPPNGNTYSYYACHEKLADLSTRLPAPPINVLMVVDGPPGSTGKHARYPCLPVVLAHFKNTKIDILLDDYARNDEIEVGALWEKDFELIGYKVATEKISMEKDAFLISACPQ